MLKKIIELNDSDNKQTKEQEIFNNIRMQLILLKELNSEYNWNIEGILHKIESRFDTFSISRDLWKQPPNLPGRQTYLIHLTSLFNEIKNSESYFDKYAAYFPLLDKLSSLYELETEEKLYE